MKKKMLVLVTALILSCTQLYAGNGDLVVNGNLSVGTTDTTSANLRVVGSAKVDKLTAPTIHAGGNHYNVLSYYLNATPTYGVKIKTNIPFTNYGPMPTVIIEGYSYGKTAPMSLALSWYAAYDVFQHPVITSMGAYMPPVRLANENGKVVIFIDDRQSFLRFTARAFANGKGETDSMFEGWTAVDEPLSGSSVLVEYKDNPVIHTGGSHYNVLSYNLNGTPVNGVKIKTNIPYIPSSPMPTLFIEGYCYGLAAPIGLTLTWYVSSSGGHFYEYKVSSWGAYTPPIKLANEDGKVVIFIDDRQYYSRFTVRAFGYGRGELNSMFEGWTASDEVISATGTDVVSVPYVNKFSGAVDIDGTLSATVKNFDIKDPRYNDEQTRLIHSSLEGPEVGVYYRGEIKLEQGLAEVRLPDYFEALVRKENRTVLLTPKFEKNNELLCNVAASDVKNGAFTIKAFGVPDSVACNHKVFWEVKAERTDVEKLITNKTKEKKSVLLENL
jgi:hypothetical protein